ncbi:MAG: MutT/NUDIX family protein [uncultured bacterium]|nr:MAG: MutT/NUDIX family protein [uncultured bacterium]OGH89469.1 MAG: hypothetical protein A2507_04345 [Candidatus Magasanikbacteria bacterium RIFOXYD12_FULL_33_17]HAO52078.1 hypothetical protein [Candidatus Magasanikbacteria bacterium]
MNKTVTGEDKDGNKIEMDVASLNLRPSVYGIIVKDNKVLMFKQDFGYTLPGGGVEIGEKLKDAISREIKEETGYQVKMKNIVEVTDSFFKLPGSGKNCQTIRMFFLCEIISEEISEIHLEPTETIFNSKPEWIELSELENIKIGDNADLVSIIKKAM